MEKIILNTFTVIINQNGTINPLGQVTANIFTNGEIKGFATEVEYKIFCIDHGYTFPDETEKC